MLHEYALAEGRSRCNRYDLWAMPACALTSDGRNDTAFLVARQGQALRITRPVFQANLHLRHVDVVLIEDGSHGADNGLEALIYA